MISLLFGMVVIFFVLDVFRELIIMLAVPVIVGIAFKTIEKIIRRIK